MNTLHAISTFLAVAEAGSFAAAARRLNISTTAASRHVSDLEQALGVTLLRRTTRQVSLTEAGTNYLPRAASILEALDQLNAEMRLAEKVPQGSLRITAPPAIGRDWIVPVAVDFADTYPSISLEMDLTERVVDLVAEGYDAAIRAGTLPSSALIAHRIVDIDYLLCASPVYLQQFGTPIAPADVSRHQCLSWLRSGSRWKFSNGIHETSVPVKLRLQVSDLTGLRDAALRGLGLAILPAIRVHDDIGSGRLVSLLDGYQVENTSLSLVRPATPFVPTKLRVFIDFITSQLRQTASAKDSG